VLVTSPETRSYVRMIIERLFATLPVLSHVELAKGLEIKILGAIVINCPQRTILA
jgi:flagellar biosynthesis protein FlhA